MFRFQLESRLPTVNSVETMWKSYLTAALVLLPVVLGSQECYVCIPVKGEKSLELNYQFPRDELPVCQRGVTPPPKLCPPRYKGCVTQYNGEYVTKTCGELLMNICQEVNNVEYCYCTGNLCNKKDKNITIHSTFEPPQIVDKGQPSDDEDIIDGSGSGSPAHDLTSLQDLSTHEPKQNGLDQDTPSSSIRIITFPLLVITSLLIFEF